MKGECFRPQLCTVMLYSTGGNLANEVNSGMNHAPGAGSITQPVDLQSSQYHCTPAAPPPPPTEK